MPKIAAEALIERLADWGVDTIFGLPGDGINGLMEGLRRHEDKLRFVLVHHEEAAAFMATGYAKSTGRLGVCLATSGPGAIHLLNGLYDAKLDHAPVLAITGMQETQMLGTGYQQEVSLEKLFMDVAVYNEMIRVPVQTSTLVDLAVRHTLSRRGVAHLTIPADIQVADADANPWEAVAPAVVKCGQNMSTAREPRHCGLLHRGWKPFSCWSSRELADGALAVISALVSGVFLPKTPRDLLLAPRNTAPRRCAVATPTLTFYQAAVAAVRDKKLARDDKKWLG